MRTYLENTKLIFTALIIENIYKIAKSRYFRRKMDLYHIFDAINELWMLLSDYLPSWLPLRESKTKSQRKKYNCVQNISIPKNEITIFYLMKIM